MSSPTKYNEAAEHTWLGRVLRGDEDASEGVEWSWIEPDSDYTPSSKCKTISALDVQVERAKWLWSGRIPLGTVTLLAGDGGVGKSTFTCALAAALSKADKLGGFATVGSPGATLIVSTEDHYGAILKPRLLVAGAAMGAINFWDQDDVFTLPGSAED